MLIHCSATPAVTSGLFIFVDDEQMPMHMVTFSNLDPYKMTIWVIALVTQISLLQWGFMLKIWVVQNITDVGFFLAIFTNVLTVNKNSGKSEILETYFKGNKIFVRAPNSCKILEFSSSITCTPNRHHWFAISLDQSKLEINEWIVWNSRCGTLSPRISVLNRMIMIILYSCSSS